MQLLRPEIQYFIDRHLNFKTADIMLKASKFPEWNMKAIARQLFGKQIAKKKLPTWFKNKNILYPIRLSMEQCSSEITAKYKNSIINSDTFRAIDLTGGFGVDSYFISKKFKSLIYCEQNNILARLVSHNFNVLKQTNFEVFIGDGIKYLKSLDKLDWIIVDPSRRKQSKRVFRLQDCEPNIINLLDLFFDKAEHILIKTSPLLDIRQTLSNLKAVKEVHTIAVNNDCKEVLYVLEKDFIGETQFFCINFRKKYKEKFCFTLLEEKESLNLFSKPLEFLYEANSAIMKAGAFKSIGTKYNLYKLHKHSHLYTSQKLNSEFPGRCFKVNKVLNPDKKYLTQYISGKGNLACRNFPQKVDQLKKSLKIKDGGSDYIFATKLCDDKLKLIICSKL